MAVKRTGRKQAVPLKKSSFFSSGGRFLEKLGRPFFWLILGIIFFLFSFFSLAGKTTFFILKLIFLSIKNLFKKFRQLKKIIREKKPKLKTPLILPLKIKLPKIWPPKITLPQVSRPKISFKWISAFLFLALSALLGTGVYWFILKDLPQPERLSTRPQVLTTKIYDRHGELLYKIFRNQNRTLVKLEELPLSLVQATIAIEDAEFYQHPGFSPKAIIRAFFQNLNGKKLYGGSTLTQQLVKNTLLSPEKTFQRKIKEVVLAFWVEQKFTKDQILQMYLNEVGYGGAAYGVEEASQAYFGKTVRNLNLAESALLAGLPASPTAYSPFGAQPEKAKERQETVLKRMVQEGFITTEQAEKARKEELKFAPQRTDIQAPHFVMYVKDLLVAQYGQQMIEEGGLEVKTSLDLKLQEKVQTIVKNEINKLASLKVGNGAALVTKPQTGEILAMVGSKDYFDLENDGNVNVTLRPRQPGSAIKPVMYSLALEKGFTAATIIPDTPITYQIPGQPPYSPKNYDNRFHGQVSLRTALASSYNVPAVKVLSALGVENMVKRGREMGITTWEDSSRFGLSLTLGGGEVKMVDLVVTYSVLANLGKKVVLKPVLEVKDSQGKILKNQEYNSSFAVLDSRIAYILTDILADNQARTPAFGPQSVLNITNRPYVAVKTGTTQNLKDNWTIGYTPDFLAAVWVGNNDNAPMSQIASGVTGASPIWNLIMREILKNVPDQKFPKPENLNKVEICPSTGTLPCRGCGGKWEYFIPGTEPQAHCFLKNHNFAPL